MTDADERMRDAWAAERLALAGVSSDTHEVRYDGAVVLRTPPPATPQTDPATEDDIDELAERIVRRAQYVALKTFKQVLESWTMGAASNHEALGHPTQDGCAERWHNDDIRSMLGDAADELRIPRLDV